MRSGALMKTHHYEQNAWYVEHEGLPLCVYVRVCVRACVCVCAGKYK